MSSGMIFFCCLVGFVGLAAAGEEPLQPAASEPHHVTTVCIQVHGHSPMCGPMVTPEATQDAARAASLQVNAARGSNLQAARASDQQLMFQNARAADQQMMNARQFGQNDAVLQGYYDDVPVYKMRSAASDAEKNQQAQFGKANPPCPEPSSRSTGSIVSVVQPNNGLLGYNTPLIGGVGGLGGMGGIGLHQPPSIVTVSQPGLGGGYLRSAASSRTIPIAPWGVEQQQQQMRASQFAAARSQQIAAMRAAGNVPDCPDSLPPPHMRAADRFQNQQRMRDAYPPQNFASMRDSAELARQCAQQEQEIREKAEKISKLEKQLEQLSSMSEKTTIEQKTVSVKSSASSDSLQQKDVTSDKLKDAQGNPIKQKK